ncbi:hypothetical protein A3Q56_01654 [Intoshia linei]|uniref:Armadillo repeat-containing domain-containing protein n=1 Tax=Intoshia linei TaxID=1819745 RepID=A0A177B8H5_9BILA|nr:hypothetical protein A3Q56_01654 [Intoshia linei]
MFSNAIRSKLDIWDNASRLKRMDILNSFMKEYEEKVITELESSFENAASLFFTRIVTWIRLTYMCGDKIFYDKNSKSRNNKTYLFIQLKAIKIFFMSTYGNEYIEQFISMGGVLTLLEIVNLKNISENSKQQALLQVLIIGNKGRKYKELICQSYGVRSVAECLAIAKLDETQNLCSTCLHSFSDNNPKYQLQVYKGLIALLPCKSPRAQQTSLYLLRFVQPQLTEVSSVMIDPLLGVLQSMHLEVQYECYEFLKILMQYKSVRCEILKGLVKLLIPKKSEILKFNLQQKKQNEIDQNLNDGKKTPCITKPMPILVQQASAAKSILILAKESKSIAECLLKFNVIIIYNVKSKFSKPTLS